MQKILLIVCKTIETLTFPLKNLGSPLIRAELKQIEAANPLANIQGKECPAEGLVSKAETEILQKEQPRSANAL